MDTNKSEAKAAIDDNGNANRDRESATEISAEVPHFLEREGRLFLVQVRFPVGDGDVIEMGGSG